MIYVTLPYAITGLMETCVTVITVKHLHFLIILGTEAYFAVSLEKTPQLLDCVAGFPIALSEGTDVCYCVDSREVSFVILVLLFDGLLLLNLTLKVDLGLLITIHALNCHQLSGVPQELFGLVLVALDKIEKNLAPE
jgi:hypothetical protein